MRLLPASTFLMGTPSDEVGRESNEDQHQVVLAQNFYLMTTEVTQRMYEALLQENPSEFQSCGSDCPVEMVDWHDAARFANALSQYEGYDLCYSCSEDECASVAEPYDCSGYRLPTEAEWEYAARSGSSSAFGHPMEVETSSPVRSLTVDPISRWMMVHFWEILHGFVETRIFSMEPNR